ncbi:MAG: MipA/OmpV family protein [Leptospirillia bacterium]
MTRLVLRSQPIVPLLLLLALFLPVSAHANHEGKPHPLWELGVAGGWAGYDAYAGSSNRKAVAAGTPYLIYRGKYLRASGKSARIVLYERPRFWIDISGSGWPPVNTEDAPARSGMPKLDLMVEGGPRINWVAFRTDTLRLRLRFPVRAAVSFDTPIDASREGYTIEPSARLRWRPGGEEGRVGFTLTLSAFWGSAAYNAYYYDVDPAFATGTRPAHHAGPGLDWLSARLSVGWRITPDVVVGAFVDPKWLGPGSVDDSPLVEKDRALNLGAGINWVVWRSGERVSGREVNDEAVH